MSINLKRWSTIIVSSILLLSFSKAGNNDMYINDIINVDTLRFRESENNIQQFHKYYISVSNATFSKSAKSVQMISRFFIDDMEDVLNMRQEKAVVLGDSETIEDLYPLLKDYIARKLTVQINGAASIPSFLGAEYESDQIVLYIELPSESVPNEITIKFNAFLEMFEDQKNLIHMKINGKRRTLLIDKNNPTDTVKF
jgi:hypothetical protein